MCQVLCEAKCNLPDNQPAPSAQLALGPATGGFRLPSIFRCAQEYAYPLTAGAFRVNFLFLSKATAKISVPAQPFFRDETFPDFDYPPPHAPSFHRSSLRR